ncbi:MAG: hypothetical protein ACRDZR_05790 [Acidimicrobiales bacterium]
MSRPSRVAIVLSMLAVVVALVVFAAMAFVGSTPPTVDLATGHRPGQPVNLVIQTVPAMGYTAHPGWVSYLVRDPDGQWIHTTLWQLPAHTRINVTEYQYDSGSPLRNQYFGRVTGTIGRDATLTGRRFSVLNSYKTGIGHTFTIPSLDISVPLAGVSTTAKNQCPGAPCHLNSAHHVVRFSFMTPGVGQYRWQCFVPCGGGFVFGNGGPMSTVGYMGGFLKVVA